MPSVKGLDGFLNKYELSDRDLADYLNGKGWGVEHPSTFRIDLEEEFLTLWKKVEPFTMISMERGYAVYQAVKYILQNDLPGRLCRVRSLEGRNLHADGSDPAGCRR